MMVTALIKFLETPTETRKSTLTARKQQRGCNDWMRMVTWDLTALRKIGADFDSHSSAQESVFLGEMALNQREGQNMDAFFQALTAGKNKIPPEFDWFAPLLGDWDFTYTDGLGGGRAVQGEWLFRRALNGTGVEDLFICPSRATMADNPQSDGEYGAAIRMFTPKRVVTTWPTAAKAMCACSPS